MKLRTPGTLSAAINDIKYKLSEKECARLLDRSESLIRKWVDPDDPALPNMRQCLLLDAAYIQAGFGEPPIQNWYMQRLEGIASDAPKDVRSIVLSTLQAQSAIGQLASLIAELTKRGDDNSDDLSSNERAVLLGLIENLSANLDNLEDAIQEKLDTLGPISLSKVQIK
jgi:hypothetical protein